MKKFHLSDILSIITGKMVSVNGMSGVYDVLCYLTGKEICTFQVPFLLDVSKVQLLTMFPYFANIKADQITNENANEWIVEAISIYGESVEI